MFALVDCQNFYVSCERVFDPKLRGVPVAVLSNNDGCIIARSDEVKALGVPMGAPAFQWRDVLQKHRVRVFSSNYALYGDMSQRVMTTLSGLVPGLDVYSIDEAFLRVPPTRHDGFARQVRRAVYDHTGIPVGVGLGRTKTLAKVGNRLARQHGGHFDTSSVPLARLLGGLPVEKVWGIGSRLAKRLARHGIYTAWALTQQPDAWIKKHLTIGGLRTVWELRGRSCIDLETQAPPRKSATCSRSFGSPVQALGPLREAVARYASRVGEKLRAGGQVAAALHVFVVTKPVGEAPRDHAGVTVTLPQPTAHTPRLIRYAHLGLDTLYRAGLVYRKAGVAALHLGSAAAVQQDLFTEARPAQDARLMEALDAVNRRYGGGTLFFAAAGTQRSWTMKQAQRSPRYTTRWDEVLPAR